MRPADLHFALASDSLTTRETVRSSGDPAILRIKETLAVSWDFGPVGFGTLSP